MDRPTQENPSAVLERFKFKPLTDGSVLNRRAVTVNRCTFAWVPIATPTTFAIDEDGYFRVRNGLLVDLSTYGFKFLEETSFVGIMFNTPMLPEK